MSHVPRATLGLGALVRENYLVTCRTTWLEEFGMMTTAIYFRVGRIKKVNEIDEKLATCATRETTRMPAGL